MPYKNFTVRFEVHTTASTASGIKPETEGRNIKNSNRLRERKSKARAAPKPPSTSPSSLSPSTSTPSTPSLNHTPKSPQYKLTFPTPPSNLVVIQWPDSERKAGRPPVFLLQEDGVADLGRVLENLGAWGMGWGAVVLRLPDSVVEETGEDVARWFKDSRKEKGAGGYGTEQMVKVQTQKHVVVGEGGSGVVKCVWDAEAGRRKAGEQAVGEVVKELVAGKKLGEWEEVEEKEHWDEIRSAGKDEKMVYKQNVEMTTEHLQPLTSYSPLQSLAHGSWNLLSPTTWSSLSIPNSDSPPPLTPPYHTPHFTLTRPGTLTPWTLTSSSLHTVLYHHIGAPQILHVVPSHFLPAFQTFLPSDSPTTSTSTPCLHHTHLYHFEDTLNKSSKSSGWRSFRFEMKRGDKVVIWPGVAWQGFAKGMGLREERRVGMRSWVLAGRQMRLAAAGKCGCGEQAVEGFDWEHLERLAVMEEEEEEAKVEV